MTKCVLRKLAAAMAVLGFCFVAEGVRAGDSVVYSDVDAIGNAITINDTVPATAHPLYPTPVTRRLGDWNGNDVYLYNDITGTAITATVTGTATPTANSLNIDGNLGAATMILNTSGPLGITYGINMSGNAATLDIRSAVTAGSLQVGGSALTVNGGSLTLNSTDTESNFLGGTLTVTNNGVLNGGGSTGGIINLGSGATAAVMNVGTGAADNATLQSARIRNTSGYLNFNGNVAIDSNVNIESAGTTNFNTNLGTAANRLASLSVTGGGTNVNTGYTLYANSASVGNTGTLSVYGTMNANALSQSGALSTTNVAGTLYADSLAFGGGTMNVYAGANLAVNQAVAGAAGNLIMRGGDAAFANGIDFTGGALRSYAAGSAVAGNVGIGAGATLDTQLAGLTITGNLRLDGTYAPGASSSGVVMAVVQGGTVTINQTTAKVEMSQVEKLFNAGQTAPLQILQGTMANAYAGTAATLKWRYVINGAAGGDGLYVTSRTLLSLDESYNDLLAKWDQHPRVGNGNAHNLITRDFFRVIYGAGEIIDGVGPVSQDDLSGSGLANARNLYGIGQYGLGYDALMLYNGSGLALMNQANLMASARVQQVIDTRNDRLRQEIKAIREACDAGVALTSERYDPRNEPMNRLWITGLNTTDETDAGAGFAGFKNHYTGVVLGYDKLCGDFVYGGAFAYTAGGFTDKSALIDATRIYNYAFDLYGTYYNSCGYFVTGTAGYSYSKNKLNSMRSLAAVADPGAEWAVVDGWNSARFGSDNWLASLKAGYDWEPVDYLTITPSIGIRYANTRNSGHTQHFTPEDGSPGYDTLNAGRVKNWSAVVPVEVAASYDIVGDEKQLLTVSGTLGYAYDMHGANATGVTGYDGLGMLGNVDIVGDKIGRNIFHLGLGLRYYYKRFEFGLDYDYYTRSKFSSQNVTATLGMGF